MKVLVWTGKAFNTRWAEPGVQINQRVAYAVADGLYSPIKW